MTQKILKVTPRKAWVLDSIAPYARDAVLRTQEPYEIELVLLFEGPKQLRVKTVVTNDKGQIIFDDDNNSKKVEAEELKLPPSDLELRTSTALEEIQRWLDLHTPIISMNTKTILKFVFARARLKGMCAESHAAAAKTKGQASGRRW